MDCILEATARVLATQGFAKTSTNLVAEAAGVSIGSLYQYFPSKEALVTALVERHANATMSEVGRTVARVVALPPAEAVREMVDTIVRIHAAEDPALHRVFMEEVPRNGMLERMQEMKEMLRAYLIAHQGELRVTDPELAAFVAVHTVEALTHAALLYHPARLRDGALAREITDLIVRYFIEDRATERAA
jgi:AcrR family transcriptional regulator